MTRPGWATFYAVVMILIGGCGAISDLSDLNVDKMMAMQEEVYEGIEKAENEKKASMSPEDSLKMIKKDSFDAKVFGVFGDTIVKDSTNSTSMTATIKSIMKMSPYRKMWMKRFAMMGLVLAILFVTCGVFMFTRNKLTIQIVLTTLALSIGLGLMQLFVYKADLESSNLVSKSTTYGLYFSIFFDVLLLIVFMVLDKTYYAKADSIGEDYYDA